jgi:hypothetical protein
LQSFNFGEHGLLLDFLLKGYFVVRGLANIAKKLAGDFSGTFRTPCQICFVFRFMSLRMGQIYIQAVAPSTGFSLSSLTG